MIRTDELTRRFGDVLAVDCLTLTIDDGEVFGLLGPNGAGKTTTLRMLSGLIGISGGRAIVDSLDVGVPEHAERVRARLGLLPEENGLYPDLTAWQTLDFYARLHHVRNRRQRVGDLLERLDLGHRAHSPVSTFSKGMKQRLAIARALVNEPRLVFLDEPTANLDPQASLDIRDVIRELQQRGCTVIINTHRLDEAERTCDRIGILRTQLLRVARPRELNQRAAVVIDVDSSVDLQDALQSAARGSVERLANSYRIILGEGVSVPDVVAAAVHAGGRIAGVRPERTTLEDLYLEAMADAR